MSENVPERDLADLEAGLRGLAPAAARIDRDRLLFRAGQVSARRPGWLWPSAAAVLALTTAGLTGALALRPAPQVVERVVVVHVPAPAPPPRAPQPPAPPSPKEAEQPARAEVAWVSPVSEGYLRLRDQVLRWGADALPASPRVAAPDRPAESMSLYNLSEWLSERASGKTGGSL